MAEICFQFLSFMSMSIRFPGTVRGLNRRALSPAHLLLFSCKILFYLSFLFLHPHTLLNLGFIELGIFLSK